MRPALRPHRGPAEAAGLRPGRDLLSKVAETRRYGVSWGCGGCVRQPYGALKITLKTEIDEAAWATLHSDTSRAFDKPKSGRIAVKVINHLGDEVMKVFRVV